MSGAFCPELGFWLFAWGLLVLWHPALLFVCEEEALMKLGYPLEISKIQQVIRRILAELERLFHNLHCHFKDNGLPAFQTSLAKVRFVWAGASSPDSAFLSFPLIPAFSVKKTYSLRQATNLPFVLVPLKFPLVSGSQPCNFNCKNSVNNERFWLISSFISVRHSYDWCIDHHDVCLL